MPQPVNASSNDALSIQPSGSNTTYLTVGYVEALNTQHQNDVAVDTPQAALLPAGEGVQLSINTLHMGPLLEVERLRLLLSANQSKTAVNQTVGKVLSGLEQLQFAQLARVDLPAVSVPSLSYQPSINPPLAPLAELEKQASQNIDAASAMAAAGARTINGLPTQLQTTLLNQLATLQSTLNNAAGNTPAFTGYQQALEFVRQTYSAPLDPTPVQAGVNDLALLLDTTNNSVLVPAVLSASDRGVSDAAFLSQQALDTFLQVQSFVFGAIDQSTTSLEKSVSAIETFSINAGNTVDNKSHAAIDGVFSQSTVLEPLISQTFQGLVNNLSNTNSTLLSLGEQTALDVQAGTTGRLAELVRTVISGYSEQQQALFNTVQDNVAMPVGNALSAGDQQLNTQINNATELTQLATQQSVQGINNLFDTVVTQYNAADQTLARNPFPSPPMLSMNTSYQPIHSASSDIPYLHNAGTNAGTTP